MNAEDRPATRWDPRDTDPLTVEEPRQNVDDGALEYDAEHRWLTFTERLGEKHVEWGATEIVASEVRPWFGLRAVAAFERLSGLTPETPVRSRSQTRPSLFTTLVAIALLFALAYFVASWLQERAAIQEEGSNVDRGPGDARAVAGAGHRASLHGAAAPVADGAALGAGVRERYRRPNALGRPAPAPAVAAAPRSLSGTATWCAPTPRYCGGWGGNAHLGAVASFHYGDKPYLVTVRHGSRRTTVLVVSFCACGRTLIDLSPAAFSDFSPDQTEKGRAAFLTRGRINVTVSRGGIAPATDTVR